MSDFDKIVGQVSTVATQVASVIGQFTGHPPQGYGMPAPTYAMPQDRTTWSPQAMPAYGPVLPNQPVTPNPVGAPGTAPAPGGFMAVLSSFFSKIVSFFKGLFGGNQATAAGTTATTLTGISPASFPAASTDAREQLFQMIPIGQGTVLGFVPVAAARYADRILVNAGSFGKAAVLKSQGEYYYYQNDDKPLRIAGVTSSRNAAGDTHFDLALENGKMVGADILADGHTLRYQNYTLTLR